MSQPISFFFFFCSCLYCIHRFDSDSNERKEIIDCVCIDLLFQEGIEKKSDVCIRRVDSLQIVLLVVVAVAAVLLQAKEICR